MSSDIDVLYLSPHLDDVALSCGGRVAAQAAGGSRILVATLFTADEPAPDALSPLAREAHRWFELDGAVMARRREEDEAACLELGAEVLHLGLSDALYRQTGSLPAYSDLASLFSARNPEDSADAQHVADTLAPLPQPREIVAPLGIGGHVDHLLTRQGAALLAVDRGAELLFYEDFPYVTKRGALRATLGAEGAASWSSETVDLDARALDAKVRACLAYSSQVPALFKTARRGERRIRRFARRRGGERYWRRA